MFTDRVQALADEKGIKINQLLRDVGLGAGTFSTWKDRGTIPNGETLERLADYFQTSVDYLLGRTDQKEKPSEEGEDVVVVSRNGERFVHHLNPEQIKLLEDMIKQFGGDN